MANILNTSPTFRGVGVHWACNSTGVTGAGTFKLQGSDHTLQSDTEIVQDGTGFAVNKTYYNFNETASLDCIITSGSNTGAVTPTLAEPGDMLTITDTVYTQLAGTDWIVDNASVRRSNTSAMRVTYSLTRYPLITG